MNLGELLEEIRPFAEDPNFEEIEAGNLEIGRRVDELHFLIKQTLVSCQIERLVSELVEICQEEYKEPIISGD